MQDNGALIPDTPIIPVDEYIDEEEQKANNEAQAHDNALAEVYTHQGWKTVVDKLDKYIDDFRTGKFMGDLKDAKLEEVGQKFVIASTIAGICEDIKGTVLNAAESVANNRGR